MMTLAKNTVTVALAGGLGNQLFQAAAGLALARRTEANLQFDLAFFATKKNQAYQLASLSHGAGLVTHGRLQRPNAARKLFAKLHGSTPAASVPGYSGMVYEQPGFDFDPAFERLEPPCHLTGFFQSERYFAAHSGLVRQLFNPGLAAKRTAGPLIVRADTRNSVSVHVRRGDYVHDPRTRAVHGVLDADFYQQAIERIRAGIADPDFLIFSDDIAAARALLGEGQNMIYVEGGSALDDLYLMSRCQHHVIANSSFSWWGAYFGVRDGGLTIAPRQWFTDEKLRKLSIADLFPKAWIVL